jgi:hypothetical protein
MRTHIDDEGRHTYTPQTTGTAPLIVRLTEAILELDHLNGELDTASVHDAIADVLRQTTDTAPLIERLARAMVDLLDGDIMHATPGYRRMKAEEALTGALGPDVLVIEREQARKDISDLMMEDLFEARFEDYLDDKDAFRKRCDDYADAIIKAVEERP